jgi:ABC-2 type transport system ATP-binding protein
MIEIKGFCKSYGRLHAVKSLKLSVPKGQVFGMIGPNGAGKTTTFRFLATLLEPTDGSATINGYDVVRQVRDVRRSMGYMPDSFGVYNGMRVWEFLDFFALAYGVAKVSRKRLINDVLALVDLIEKRNDLVNGLSRGMKQRLCPAKTLVHDPPVLILDEPASGLDPRARVEMKEFLKVLRGMGKTILISSHILSELADCCDSVAILDLGALVACGGIDELVRSLKEHRTVEIDVLDDAPGAEQFLAWQAGVRDVSREDRRIRFDFTGGDPELADLNEELIRRRHRVVWVREDRPSLEKVFMNVTQGRVQ